MKGDKWQSDPPGTGNLQSSLSKPLLGMTLVKAAGPEGAGDGGQEGAVNLLGTRGLGPTSTAQLHLQQVVPEGVHLSLSLGHSAACFISNHIPER